MSDYDPQANRSMFEPSEQRPSWGLTPAQFQQLTCDHCGEPFVADAAGGVAGGLTILDDDGTTRYYHGYDFQRGNCFDRALRALEGGAG